MINSIGWVDSVRVTALLDNYANHEKSFYAQHGIAILIEVSYGELCRKILLDVGQSAEPILHNMKLLNIDPSSIDAIFLSHCHYDHTGGLNEMLSAVGKDTVPVIAHPDIFRDNYVFDPFIRSVGITAKNRTEAIEAVGGHLVLTKEAFEILPGVLSTGEVPSRTNFEKRGIGTFNLVGGLISCDYLEDDMSVIVNVKDVGLVVIVGCSHAGIINILTHSKDITEIDKLEAVVGGFHLIGASDEQIAKTVRYFKDANITAVAGHCTGFKACSVLYQELQDNFQLLYSGKILSIP